jgi:RNA polymerase-binding transcription factor DksA
VATPKAKHPSIAESISRMLRYADIRVPRKGVLRRMQEGTYGVCIACEEPISAKRLQAVPWAELCLGCQERADRDAGGHRNANDEEALELGSPIGTLR